MTHCMYQRVLKQILLPFTTYRHEKKLYKFVQNTCNMCFDNKTKKMLLSLESEICSYFGKAAKRLMKCVLERGTWH